MRRNERQAELIDDAVRAALGDVYRRATRAADRLMSSAERKVEPKDRHERGRLLDKASGVLLAASYIEEAMRR